MQSVEEIVALLREFPVSEIMIEQDGVLIAAVSGPNTYCRQVVDSLATHDDAGSEVERLPVQQEERSMFITSTMVGNFHLPTPALRFGTEVLAGQCVGAIESIKVLNDVLAQVGGTLAETLVEDGAPVEYGQPLYRLV